MAQVGPGAPDSKISRIDQQHEKDVNLLKRYIKEKNFTEISKLASAIYDVVDKMNLRSDARIVNPVTGSQTHYAGLKQYLRGKILNRSK